jgi:hypothetical protein
VTDRWALLSLSRAASSPRARDETRENHVYKTSNNECEIDTRDHSAMKNQRGTDNCLGHHDYRMDAEKTRKEKVKSGACKCPSGNNC